MGVPEDQPHIDVSLPLPPFPSLKIQLILVMIKAKMMNANPSRLHPRVYQRRLIWLLLFHYLDYQTICRAMGLGGGIQHQSRTRSGPWHHPHLGRGPLRWCHPLLPLAGRHQLCMQLVLRNGAPPATSLSQVLTLQAFPLRWFGRSPGTAAAPPSPARCPDCFRAPTPKHLGPKGRILLSVCTHGHTGEFA